MHRTRIKICGVTGPHDALAAVAAGADAIGMILHADAPRKISLDVASQIVRCLPPMVMAVGVFVDATPAMVMNIARELNIRHVQLHGHESPSEIDAFGDFTVTKAFRPKVDLAAELGAWASAMQTEIAPHLHGLLIETARSDQVGGTGIESDWAALGALRDRHPVLSQIPFIAAGGLRPQNVGRVIALLRPWAVDVSSGVEESPGRKSPVLLQAFCQSVRAADQIIDEGKLTAPVTRPVR